MIYKIVTVHSLNLFAYHLCYFEIYHREFEVKIKIQWITKVIEIKLVVTMTLQHFLAIQLYSTYCISVWIK